MASLSLSTSGSHGNSGWVPYDIGIMLIDEDPTSLLFIHTLLQTCHYRVVSFDNPIEALCELIKRTGEFDLVIVDLHTVAMPGFNLVERIAKGMRLPVVTTCADEDSQILHQALDVGACFHLVKPITINSMEFVWKKSWRGKVKEPVGPPKVLKFANEKQHNKMMFTLREGHHGLPTGKRVLQIGGSSSVKVARDESSSMRRKDVVLREKDEDSDCEEQSKPRLMWDTELHKRFLVALALLGDDAVPTSIIGIMNVVGLTTKQVASHLQKYRKRVAKENRLKEKELKSISKQKKSLSTTSSTPVCNKRPIETFGNDEPYQKSTMRKTPFILPKPPASSSSSSSQFSAFGLRKHHHNLSSSSPLVLPMPSTASASNEIAPLLQSQRTVEFSAGLWTYQPNSNTRKTPLILPKPPSTDQTDSFNADGGINPVENNLLPSIVDPDPSPSSDPSECNLEPETMNDTVQEPAVFDLGFSDPSECNLDPETMNDTVQEPAVFDLGFSDPSECNLDPETMNDTVQEPAIFDLGFSDQFGCNVDSTVGNSSSVQCDGEVETMNTMLQEPTIFDLAYSDWPGIDEFAGIIVSQTDVQKDQTDEEVGQPTDPKFDCDFDKLKDLEFDDEFLNEILDDIDREELPPE